MPAAKQTAPPAKPAKPVKRDPAKTRAKILQAATTEFSAKGYSGARTEAIARRAKSNVRMIYHYFGGKDALYLAVLEEVLAQLRAEELRLDLTQVAPLDGVLQMFDFIDGHFEHHPELRHLLAFENLNRAQHLKRSTRIPAMASPVLDQLRDLLDRGVAAGCMRADVDPLHLYVTMVSLVYYGKSHAYTLSRIFKQDLLGAPWQAEHRAQHHAMLLAYLAPPPPAGSLIRPRKRPTPVRPARA